MALSRLVSPAEQEALEEAGVKCEWKDTDERAEKFCVSAFPLKVMNENVRRPERNRSPTWFSPNEAKLRLAEDRSVIYQREFACVIDEIMHYLAQS